MLFNSPLFLFVFLPACLLGWWWLRRPEHRLAWLAVASLLFYAYWEPRWLPLLAALVLVDYTAGAALARRAEPARRRLVLWLAVGLNLALLAAFKALAAASSGAGATGRLTGLDTATPGLGIVLPLGVAFITLNGISYIVDVYRGTAPAATSLRAFTSYLVMFPHLIAGPIVRFDDIGPQLGALGRRLDPELASRGLMLITLGLAKKLLIADSLAPTVDGYFATPDTLTVTSGWAAALGYSMQLYFDFSAYSEMAVGLALLLGIRFPRNFDSPYRSRNIGEFWRRWHITLGAWIRDYVFHPLGGSRGSSLATTRNLVAVMVFAGLWHGAGLTFLVFGVLHGSALAVHAYGRSRGWWSSSEALGRATTYLFVMLTMVIFRSQTLGDAVDVMAAMAGANGLTGGADVTAGFAAGLLGLLVYVNVAPDAWDVGFSSRLRPRLGVAMGVLLALAVLTLSEPSPFLYFQY